MGAPLFPFPHVFLVQVRSEIAVREAEIEFPEAQLPEEEEEKEELLKKEKIKKEEQEKPIKKGMAGQQGFGSGPYGIRIH